MQIERGWLLFLSSHLLHLPLFDTLADETRQIATFTVLHDDVQHGITAVYNAVVVPHNVWVLEFPQEVDLWDQHLFLTLSHGAIIELLPHKNLESRDALTIKNMFILVLFSNLKFKCLSKKYYVLLINDKKHLNATFPWYWIMFKDFFLWQ